MKALTLILSFFCLIGFAAIDSSAADLTVTKTADTNDGTCDADCSLREAIAAAIAGDTILFSSLFNSPQTITLMLGHIDINKGLTINGSGVGLLSVSGNNAGRIFFISGGVSVSMSGMKIRDGKVGVSGPGDAVGGGIYVAASNLSLSNVELTNNVAFNAQFTFGFGGAIYANSTSRLTFSNVNINHNMAPAGAGIASVDMSSLDLENSVIANNSGSGIVGRTVDVQNSVIMGNANLAVSGRRLSLIDSIVTGNGQGVSGGDASSSLTITRCTIADNGRVISNGTGGGVTNSGLAMITDTVIKNNVRTGWGGGIANTGTMYILNSALTGNVATQDGGGIFTASGHLFLTNSTVSGNVAGTVQQASVGGGVYNLVNSAAPSGRITITNSTISDNQTNGVGGGLRHDQINEAKIRNTIIAGNTSTFTFEEDVSGSIMSEGNNLIGSTFGSMGWIASDLLNLDPLLGPLADNGGNTFTHALLPCSPAMNAGSNVLAVDPQTDLPLVGDQRGFPRFVNSVDIGAYEKSAITIPYLFSGVESSEYFGECPTPTPTATPTATPTNTPTATPTNSPTATPTNTPTATPTNTPTATPTNTPTATPTATPTNTPTATPTNTPTATPTATPTNSPSATPTPSLPSSFDYDADGKTDVSVFRPSNGAWYVQMSAGGFYGTLFGLGDDRITPADYDGDGKTDIAVYRPSSGVWYITNSSDATVTYHVFGLAEDLPTPADYDADLRADISVFRPSSGTWYRINSSDGSFAAVQFGAEGDKPAIGDFDGDAISDIAVFRPSNGVWYQNHSSDGSFHGEQFGIDTDLIVPADYDGDSKTDLAVFRPSNGFWYTRYSGRGNFIARQFGLTGDVPAPGDFDGDGTTDISVFRPSEGVWYWNNSSDGSFLAYQFGTNGDMPTQTAYRY